MGAIESPDTKYDIKDIQLQHQQGDRPKKPS